MNLRFKILATLLTMLLPLMMSATTESTTTNLWSGEKVLPSDWSGYEKITADKFTNTKVGDELTVTVSATDAAVQWPQVTLQNKSWKTAADTKSTIVSSTTSVVKFTVTEALLAEMQDTYMVVKGAGVTITSIDLINYTTTDPDPETGKEITLSINLWEGVQAAGNWSGYTVLKAAQFSQAAVGDRIKVTVSAVDAATSYPQLSIATGSWGTMPDVTAVQLGSVVLPYTATFTITEAMLAELSSNGAIFRGCGFTMTSIDLEKTVTTHNSDPSKAYTTLWTGLEVISWNSGSNNSVLVDKSLFANATAGMKVRMNVTELAKSSVGRILANWTAFSGLKNVSPIKGTYYEYTLTDDMLTAIKASGMRVSGVGYTLTSVQLVDPDNVPYIISAIDNADIRAWEPGETPNITLTLQSVETQDQEVNIDVIITTDARVPYKTVSQKATLLSGEKKDVTTDLDLEPGFYIMNVNVNGTFVCSYTIGYNPTAIDSPYDGEADFHDFWLKGINELAATAPEFTIVKEMTEKSTAARKVYLVEMKSIADTDGGTPVNIRGYYAEPTGDKQYPAIIHFQGTDGGSSTPWCMGGDDNPEYVEFILSTRGQMINNREPYLADNVYGRDATTGKTDYYSYGFGDTRKHYYYGAYLDCLRALDFVTSREKVDSHNIFAAGGSQGGAFVYAGAALAQMRAEANPSAGYATFRALAPSITGHSDFPDDLKIVNWPASVFATAQANLGISDKEMMRFLTYFDVKNFGPFILSPTTTNFSLQDTTDPAHTNIAPFNLLSQVADADKEYYINSFLGHATASDWTSRYMAFFAKHTISAAAATEAKVAEITKPGYYKITEALRVEAANDGITYAYNNEAAIKSEPTADHKVAGFDTYEDGNWDNFDQRDWIAIRNAGIDPKNGIAAGGVYYFDGTVFTPTEALSQEITPSVSINNINRYRAFNLLHGGYNYSADYTGYKAFFVAPCSNEVANFIGKVKGGEIIDNGQLGTIDNKGVKIIGEIADNDDTTNSKFKGIIVNNNDATSAIDYNIILIGKAETTTGVGDAVADDSKAKVIAANGEINVMGANSIEIYNIGGTLISNESHTTVAPGIYLVKTDNDVVKVCVK